MNTADAHPFFLINAFKAHGKKFEYMIYENIPGDHSFDRMDHTQGRQLRFEFYKFLEKYLDQPMKFGNQCEMEQTAYLY
jgi:hypothetical protein